jgi:hypothetical protein
MIDRAQPRRWAPAGQAPPPRRASGPADPPCASAATAIGPAPIAPKPIHESTPAGEPRGFSKPARGFMRPSATGSHARALSRLSTPPGTFRPGRAPHPRIHRHGDVTRGFRNPRRVFTARGPHAAGIALGRPDPGGAGRLPVLRPLGPERNPHAPSTAAGSDSDATADAASLDHVGLPRLTCLPIATVTPHASPHLPAAIAPGDGPLRAIARRGALSTIRNDARHALTKG